MERSTREDILKLFNTKNESNFFDYFIPIIGVKSNNHIENLYGTCSYLGDNIFITAGHCIKNIDSEETKLILFNQSEGWKGEEIIDYEIFEDIDISIFKIGSCVNNIKSHKWSLGLPLILSEVFACGFPHGFNPKEQKIINRGFKGSVSGITTSDIFIKEHFFTYIETSFACPVGISGAPLVEWGGDNTIYGIITGNTRVSITVSERKEINITNNESSYYFVEDTIQLGMAVSNISIFDKYSKILKSNFVDYLRKTNLLKEDNTK
jgi:hypothetical protein